MCFSLDGGWQGFSPPSAEKCSTHRVALTRTAATANAALAFPRQLAPANCTSGETECRVLNDQGDFVNICVDVKTDILHCGNCQTACNFEDARCADGRCVCPSGDPACNDACVDYKTDSSNCGSCGNAVSPSSLGPCQPTFARPFSRMSLTFQCASGETCVDGKCAGCESGQSTCSVNGASKCVNLQTDSQNCGRCGTRVSN